MSEHFTLLSEWGHFRSFDSESHSVSLFLSEIGTNVILNRVENTRLLLLKELSAVLLFAREVEITITVG